MEDKHLTDPFDKLNHLFEQVSLLETAVADLKTKICQVYADRLDLIRENQFGCPDLSAVFGTANWFQIKSRIELVHRAAGYSHFDVDFLSDKERLRRYASTIWDGLSTDKFLRQVERVTMYLAKQKE